MSNADEPAYPTPHFQNANGDIQWGAPGMTIRQAFVMAAMQGILSSWPDNAALELEKTAEAAIRFADATLAKMEETKP